jgi:hypothetical protein
MIRWALERTGTTCPDRTTSSGPKIRYSKLPHMGTDNHISLYPTVVPPFSSRCRFAADIEES